MSLSPNSGAGHKQEACQSDAQQMISRGQRHLCEIPLKKQRKCDSICSEKRAKCRGDNGDDGEDNEDGVALPQWPVLRIISICIVGPDTRPY